MLLAPRAASAQTALNPDLVEFVPSAEDGQVFSNGQPMVVRYDLEFYVAGSSTAVQTLNIGTPALQSDGMVRYRFAPAVTPWPYPNVDCYVDVVAVGPYGSRTSVASNYFRYVSSASTNISPSISLTSPAAGTTLQTQSTITLSASASDADGVVRAVEFRVDNQLVATVQSAPFTAAWRAKTAGNHTLTAVAVDDAGARTVSAPVVINIHRKNQ